MNLKNSEVLLTINLAGALASRGRYNAFTKVDENGKKVVAIGRDKDGNIEKSEVIVLQTIQLPSYHDSSLNTKLNNEFVRFAISEDSRPKKSISAGMWKKMPEKVRLKYHIAKYVDDLYPGCEYSYVILEGEDYEN